MLDLSDIAHKILVTGSSGFLGRSVSSKLASQGYEVVGVDPSPGTPKDVTHLRIGIEAGSMRDLLAAHGITHVIHAGGVSGAMVLADAPWEVIEINVGGSLALLQAALSANVQTFVFCSSVSAVGGFHENGAIGEDYPMRPDNTYGCSKAAMEMVLRGLWRRTSLDLCSLRLTTIYGPGRFTSNVVDEIVAAACEGRIARPSAVADWPYIFVDDAADAVIAACFSSARQQLGYYLAYPEQVELADFAAAAAQAGRAVVLEVDETIAPTLRGPLNIDAAIRDFAFDPKTDHREGVRRMIAARAAG